MEGSVIYNMKTFSKFRVVFFIPILLLPFLFQKYSFAEDAKRIAVFPFEIHSKSDVLFLTSQITGCLTTELSKAEYIRVINKDTFLRLIEGKQIDKELVFGAGKKINADFVVMGSLTRLGNLISVDVTVADVKDGKTISGIFAGGTGKESLGAIAAELTDKILLKIFVKQTIEKIEFTGNHRIESGAIYNVLTSEKGKLLSERKLSSDIKAIYKMGYFSDVKVEVSGDASGKTITFILQEKPLISRIEIKGSDDIDKDDIEGVITVKPKQILNLEEVKSDVENIKTLYHDKGYLNAEVSYKIEKTGNKGTRVIFNITENKKLRIEKISFEGNKTYTDKELKDMMQVTERGFFYFISDSGLLKMDKLKQDINKLKTFYHNNGYINAQIGEPEITHDKKGIYIKIPVMEGKQFKVGKVEITGDLLSIPRADLLKKLYINKKDYFDRESIMKDIDLLSGACNDEGYAYADVIPKTVSLEKDQKVDVIYNVDKGSIVYFDRISITGNTKTRDKVIRRELAVVEGDLYSREKLKKSYMRLNRLSYFEEINFQTEKGLEKNLTDVNIQVKEKPTGMFSIGAGYSASDKAVIMAQVAQRNLFGKGQTLSLSAYLGSETKNYELSFTEPWLFDMPLWSKFDLWNTEKDYDSYDLSTKGFTTTLGYPLWEYIKGYIGYSFSTNDVKNIDEDASRWIREQEGEITSSGITVTLSRNTSNNFMFPTKGSKNKVSIEYTGGILQGDTSFTKYTANSTWFFPLPLDNVFAVKGRAGFMQKNEDTKIPIYERFFLGGMNSLRGLRNVGPKFPDSDDVMGGETMLCFNFEFIFPLIKNAGMKGVVFYDTGNAWESGYHLDDMRRTAGAGIRWYSPIGPLRLEWGHVLDRRDDESASRWEFTIGMMM
jgi:outer membrane protein insertion porin family